MHQSTSVGLIHMIASTHVDRTHNKTQQFTSHLVVKEVLFYVCAESRLLVVQV